MVAAAQASAATTYFIVGDPTGGAQDAYVLPLTKTQDIAHARQLVQMGPSAGRTIVVATIAGGFDCVNRNWAVPGAPAWSWHVKEFCNFADFTIELCDGSPTMVENDVNRWMDNTDGVICFWNYTVVRELTLMPPILPRPRLRLAERRNNQIVLALTNLPPSYVCSIERVSELPNHLECNNPWRTIASFPTTGPATNWTETLPVANQAFYRAQIECPR